MSHIIQHTFECDVCGKIYPTPEERTATGCEWSQKLSDRDVAVERTRPSNWDFIQGHLICPDHKVWVEYGDSRRINPRDYDAMWQLACDRWAMARSGLIQANSARVPLGGSTGQCVGVVNRFDTPVTAFSDSGFAAEVPPRSTAYFQKSEHNGDWCSLGVMDA